MPATLDRGIRQALLCAAREAIASRFGVHNEPPHALMSAPECSGVFVTVRVEGALRGCIGFLQLKAGLVETLVDAARRAVSEDPRFPPVQEQELDRLCIEITLLGPIEPITDPHDFTIGTHGVVLECRHRRGLLLPQVAVEHGWDQTQFLSALCQKTKLPDRAWEWPDAVLSRFEGMKFSEEDEDVRSRNDETGEKE